MTFKDLALLYEQQFLKCKYIIHTNENTIVLNGQPDNFMHLIGVEKYLPYSISKSKFYYECLEDDSISIKKIINQMQTDDKNIANIKSCYFYNIQNAIVNAKDLYYKDKNDYGICSEFKYKNKTKYHTILFKYDKSLGFCIPKSNQVDKDIKFSNVIKYKYNKRPILNVEIIKQ